MEPIVGFKTDSTFLSSLFNPTTTPNALQIATISSTRVTFLCEAARRKLSLSDNDVSIIVKATPNPAEPHPRRYSLQIYFDTAGFSNKTLDVPGEHMAPPRSTPTLCKRIQLNVWRTPPGKRIDTQHGNGPRDSPNLRHSVLTGESESPLSVCSSQWDLQRRRYDERGRGPIVSRLDAHPSFVCIARRVDLSLG